MGFYPGSFFEPFYLIVSKEIKKDFARVLGWGQEVHYRLL